MSFPAYQQIWCVEKLVSTETMGSTWQSPGMIQREVDHDWSRPRQRHRSNRPVPHWHRVDARVHVPARSEHSHTASYQKVLNLKPESSSLLVFW